MVKINTAKISRLLTKALNILDFFIKYVILYNVNFASVVWQIFTGQKEVALSQIAGFGRKR